MARSVDIVNVSGSITYQQELDLQELANTFESHERVSSVKYKPSKNHWLQTYIGKEEIYVAFYRSGKASIVGCDSLQHFHEITSEINEIMQELLQYQYDPHIMVNNIVATTSLGSQINLEHLAVILGLDSVEYEPEQFPALLYRIDSAVVLVFSSGKLVITGMTTPEVAGEVADRFYDEAKLLLPEK
jgi:transcription initiation factor TFIID TATA-box-binding protein